MLRSFSPSSSALQQGRFASSFAEPASLMRPLFTTRESTHPGGFGKVSGRSWGEIMMPAIDSFLATWSPRVLSILRIIVGLLFLEHGASKYLSLPVSPLTG